MRKLPFQVLIIDCIRSLENSHTSLVSISEWWNQNDDWNDHVLKYCHRDALLNILSKCINPPTVN